MLRFELSPAHAFNPLLKKSVPLHAKRGQTPDLAQQTPIIDVLSRQATIGQLVFFTFSGVDDMEKSEFVAERATKDLRRGVNRVAKAIAEGDIEAARSELTRAVAACRRDLRELEE